MAEIQQHAPVSTADQGESTADPGSAAGSESGVCSPQAPLPATNGHAHANGACSMIANRMGPAPAVVVWVVCVGCEALRGHLYAQQLLCHA